MAHKGTSGKKTLSGNLKNGIVNSGPAALVPCEPALWSSVVLEVAKAAEANIGRLKGWGIPAAILAESRGKTNL